MSSKNIALKWKFFSVWRLQTILNCFGIALIILVVSGQLEVYSQVQYVIGNGTNFNNAITYPAPYGRFYNAAKHHFLILSSEMQAAGASAGHINSLAFHVANLNGATDLSNLSVKIKQTISTNLTTSFDSTGFTTVYFTSSFSAVDGWNTHTFSTPFNWNGTSNILFEICFNNYPSGFSANVSTFWTTTSFNSSSFAYTDTIPNVCSAANAISVSTFRPNMKIGIIHANDAGIVKMIQPLAPVSGGVQPISVVLKNFGFNTLTSVKINWFANGVQQNQYSWNGSLIAGASTTVQIGSFVFAQNTPYNFIVATNQPNNSLDLFTGNDTLKIVKRTALNGIYTIGGTLSATNFPTFTDASYALYNDGVAGAVTFNVQSGTYNEQLSLSATAGVSSTNTITFQSQNGNPNSVVLSYVMQNFDDYVVKLDSARFVSLKNLTLTTAAFAGKIVILLNNATNNSFIGNTFSCSGLANGVYDIFSVNGTNNSNDNLTIRNNTIHNGLYGIYISGSGLFNKVLNLIVDDNIFDNQLNGGIFLYYADSPELSRNGIQSSLLYSSYFGISASFCQGNIRIKQNKIVCARGYSMTLNQCSSPAYQPASIVNNFLYAGGSNPQANSTLFGMFLNSCVNFNVYFNSIRVQSAVSQNNSAACYLSGGKNLNFENNIYDQTGGGYSFYATKTEEITSSNYNDFYAPSGILTYYVNPYFTLSEWQSATGFDGNSISKLPLFSSVTDLHTSNPALNGRGINIQGITDDIDGQIRNGFLPDIGADEFIISGLDASISWIAPVAPSSAGNNSVVVRITNLRTTPIASLILSYSDGNSTTQQRFDFVATPIGAESTRSFTFSTPYSLNGEVGLWASILKVNDKTDDDSLNNTTNILVLRPALSGSYSICTNGNFRAISSAVSALKIGGILAPVTFNLCAGTYSEQVVLPKIAGTSTTNTITFQSASGNPNDVIITTISTVAPNSHTIYFSEDAGYYNLKNLSVVPPSIGINYLVEFKNGAHNILIQHCIVDAGLTSLTFYPIYANGVFVHDIILDNNQITGGEKSIIFDGGAGGKSQNITISNNSIQDFSMCGIYCASVNNLIISGNDISRPFRENFSNLFYGIFLNSFVEKTLIEKNRIHSMASAPQNFTNSVGIFCYGNNTPTPQSGNEIFIQNNLLYDLNTLGQLSAILVQSYRGIFIHHNTIALNDRHSASTAVTTGFNYSDNVPAERVSFKNNIISITRGGTGTKVAVALSNLSGVFPECDNNVYFVNGSSGLDYIGNLNGNYYLSSMSGWQSQSGVDAYSLNSDPLFFNPDGFNFHIPYFSPAARIGGILPINVAYDFDGKHRNQNYPADGAYISPATLDVVGSADFGKTGNQTAKRWEIRNTSAQDSIIVRNFALVGQGLLSFKVYRGGTSVPLPTSFSIAPGSVVQADVVFGIQGVSQAGNQIASVVIQHNAANPTKVMDVSGYFAQLTAHCGIVNLLLPNSVLDVGTTIPNRTTMTRSFILSPDVPKLDVAVKVNSYKITGRDSTLFGVSTIPEFITDSVWVSVTLDPNGASFGIKEAYLVIQNTGFNGTSTIIKLTGRVGKPVLGAPSLVELPYVVIGQTYQTDFENYALIPLTRAGVVDIELFRNPTITGSGAAQMEILRNNSKYFIRGIYSGGTVIPAGSGDLKDTTLWASPTSDSSLFITSSYPWLIAVRMKQPLLSTIQGSYSAEILLADGSGKGVSSAENYVIVSLVGQIVSDPALLPLFPSHIEYGTVPVGVPIGKILRIRNQNGVAGELHLSLSSVNFVFPNGSQTMSLTLPAINLPLDIQVAFTPTSAGAFNSVLIATGVINGSITLSGTGLGAISDNVELFCDGKKVADVVDFGSVEVGQIGTKIVSVINHNSASVQISSIGRSGDNATQFTLGTLSPSNIVPPNGASCSFPLNFIPTSTTSPLKTANISVSLLNGLPLTFSTQGRAVSSGGGFISLEMIPAYYSYGYSSGNFIFTLVNNGTSDVIINTAVILGSSNFTLLDLPASFPRTLHANTTTTFTVAFLAVGSPNGSRSGILLVMPQDGGVFPTAQLRGDIPIAHGSGEKIESELVNVGNILKIAGLFPNPVASKTTIQYELTQPIKSLTLRIYDEVGREIINAEQGSKSAGISEWQIDIENLPSGTYFITLTADTAIAANVLVKVK